jgi:hypothetical protein
LSTFRWISALNDILARGYPRAQEPALAPLPPIGGQPIANTIKQAFQRCAL